MSETSRIVDHEVAVLERVADIARELASARSVDETLHRVVELGQNYVAGCEAASLSIIHDRVVSTPAWSHDMAWEVDQAQYRTGEGPCLEAIVAQDTIVLDDLAEEKRWPRWREAIADLDVRSMMSFRLTVTPEPDAALGALNLCSTRPRAFGEQSRLFGQVFASHAAVALRSAFTEAGLETALEAREQITQAKGMLMEREHLSASEAFDRLVALSKRRRTTVRQVAEEIVGSTSGREPVA